MGGAIKGRAVRAVGRYSITTASSPGRRKQRGVKLVTADRKLLVAFPGLATSVQNFAAS